MSTGFATHAFTPFSINMKGVKGKDNLEERLETSVYVNLLSLRRVYSVQSEPKSIISSCPDRWLSQWTVDTLNQEMWANLWLVALLCLLCLLCQYFEPRPVLCWPTFLVFSSYLLSSVVLLAQFGIWFDVANPGWHLLSPPQYACCTRYAICTALSIILVIWQDGDCHRQNLLTIVL